MATKFRLYVRDKPVAPDLTNPAPMPLIGEVDRFISFEAIGRHLDVGTWTMTLQAGTDQARLLKPGRGIALFLDSSPTEVAFSGFVRSIKLVKNRETGGEGHLTVSGVCDNTIVKERLGRIRPRAVYAREDELGPEWDPVVYDGTTYRAPNNSAEWIWGVLVENMMAPELSSFGDSSRRIRYLDMPTTCPAELRALPNDSEWEAYPMKLSSIEEAVWELASKIGLSIRFVYNPETGLVEPIIRPSQDLSDTVVFDELIGNLNGYEVTAEAPVYTRVFLAGATPEEENEWRRYFELRRSGLWNPPGWQDIGTTSNPALWSDPGWGRKAIEVEWTTMAEGYLDVRETKWQYQSNPSDPGAALPPPSGSKERALFDRQRLAFFVENSQRGLITLDAIDTDTCRFVRDYNIGDTVRVLLDTSNLPEEMLDEDGVVREQIQEVAISCTAEDMWMIKPTVGSDESSTTPYVYRKLRALQNFVEATNART